MTKGEQMMADLGYELDDTTDSEVKVFVKLESEWFGLFKKIIFHNIKAITAEYYADNGHKSSAGITYDEILACAEIVKEIREND